MTLSFACRYVLCSAPRPFRKSKANFRVQNHLNLKRFIPRSLYHKAPIAKPITDDSSQQKSKHLIVSIIASGKSTLKDIHKSLLFKNWTTKWTTFNSRFPNYICFKFRFNHECRLQSDILHRDVTLQLCAVSSETDKLNRSILFKRRACCLLWHAGRRSLSFDDRLLAATSTSRVTITTKGIFWTVDSGTDKQKTYFTLNSK